jgi:hypothetical protein
MKILTCRGLAQSFTIRSLRATLRKNNPDILFLSEIKTVSTVASSILHKLGFTMLIQAPLSSSGGGFLLAWKTNVKLTSFYVSNDIICVWCYSDLPDTKWMISFVYGLAYQKHLYDFWSTLADFGVSNLDHWLCIRDFNTIIAQSDKLGGRPFNGSSSNDFCNFMNTFGMIDLSFTSNPYTWSNHRQGHSLIKERLDRGVASSQWIHIFPSFSITHSSTPY